MLCDLKETGKSPATSLLPCNQLNVCSRGAGFLPGIPPHASLQVGGGLLPLQVDAELLGLPTFEVFELFMTGIPIRAGVMQYTGGDSGWALYAHIELFAGIEQLLEKYNFKYSWDGTKP